MSGAALMRAFVEGAGSISSTSPTNTWSNIYGVGSGQSAVQTIAGLTGGHVAITLAISGSGNLFYVKNGVQTPYTGAFNVSNGDTLGFGVSNPTTGTNESGTVTVTDATHSATLATLNYVVKHG
jgi:hypothetical protein